jgi:putative intracellular protease/amidase
MQIAILLYDRFTVLDAIGPYQVLSGLPGAEVSFVAEHPGPIRDEVGSLVLSAQAGLPDVPHPDIVLVPGGPGQNNQMQDGAVHEWLRTADQTSAWTTSVCTGSLILAAAGLPAGGPPRDLALAGPGRARPAWRHTGQRASGDRRQVRDRGRRVRRH